MKMIVLFASMAVPALVWGQSVTSSPGQVQHQDAPDQRSTGVDARGDHAMGFSHQNSTHHFRLLSDGGAIEVSAKDPNDTATRDQIRMHLSHIAKMFSEGDFQAPMFIHDTVPPGVPEMQTKRDAITYTFEATPNGGRVRIASTDSVAIKAIHQFLAFQIDDHRTGDPKTVSSQR
jgi:hypothetical protein